MNRMETSGIRGYFFSLLSAPTLDLVERVLRAVDHEPSYRGIFVLTR